MSLQWVPRGHRVIDPSDPDLTTIADVGYALGIRFSFDLRPIRYEWAGPWRLGRDDVWRRDYGQDGKTRVYEFPMPMEARMEHLSERLMVTILWMARRFE